MIKEFYQLNPTAHYDELHDDLQRASQDLLVAGRVYTDTGDRAPSGRVVINPGTGFWYNKSFFTKVPPLTIMAKFKYQDKTLVPVEIPTHYDSFKIIFRNYDADKFSTVYELRKDGLGDYYTEEILRDVIKLDPLFTLSSIHAGAVVKLVPDYEHRIEFDLLEYLQSNHVDNETELSVLAVRPDMVTVYIPALEENFTFSTNCVRTLDSTTSIPVLCITKDQDRFGLDFKNTYLPCGYVQISTETKTFNIW